MADGLEGAQRGLAAVLFADVHGFSMHMAQDEVRTYGRILEARRLCGRLVGDYGGRVVQMIGDGIFAVFAEAEQAVRFALTFQRDMANDTVWSLEQQPLRFRVGIHWGEVTVTGDDIYGYHISIAERLQRLAAPGGVCISDAVRARIGQVGDFSIRPIGWRRLHNIDDAILAHEIAAYGNGNGGVVPCDEPILSAEAAVGEDAASLAVLPFTPLSSEPTDRHLAYGISADLIHNLTRFRELIVIARHSAFRFRYADDDQSTGRRLGVRYLFKGSLQRAGRRLRITCHLTEAESGVSLWADRFEGSLDDIFVFQDEVASAIAGRLAVQVTLAERRRRNRATPMLSAYGLVLRGEELSLILRPETVMHARRLFEQAAALSPDYGRPYAALSRTFNYEWRYAWSPDPQHALEEALHLALMASRQDPSDARGFAELGYAHLYRKEHEPALEAYERAIDLNPNDADILAEYADALAYNGQAARSVELLHRAMRLNPYYPDWYLWNLADAYNELRQHEEVIKTVNRMKNPSEGRRLLAANLAHLGRLDEARAQAQEILRLHPGFTLSAWAQRPPYRRKEDLAFFIEGLRRAGLPN
jgi:TolB-like protein/class 3 adenylate cyclase